MASSFALHHSPRRLLHTDTEPQWFAPSERERESSLDALERQEQALKASVRSTVLPEAPDPIGIAGAPEDRHKHNITQLLHNNNNNQQQDTARMDPTTCGGGMNACFWDKYRSRHEEWRRSFAAASSSGRYSSTTTSQRKSDDSDPATTAVVGDSKKPGREKEQLPQRQHATGSPESAGSFMSLGDDDCCY